VLAPLVLGRDVRSGVELQTALRRVKGNPFAKAGLDLAWWDLSAKMAGLPLWRQLGGGAPAVTVGADFGLMENVGALLAEVGKAAAAGFARVKLKFAPGWELDVVREVRRGFPELVLHVDCNSAYGLADIGLFRQLDKLGLAMIEQPLAHDDLLDHAALQEKLRTPICLDESITSPDAARNAIRLKACGWVNIKPGRVGGLTNALAIREICEKAGVPCWVGGMLESSVGAHHCLALATLPNMRYPSDIFPSERFYARDLGVPAVRLSAPSVITAPDVPGVGAEPDAEALESMLVEHCRIV
jgi:O-succinylbenzoate synthase